MSQSQVPQQASSVFDERDHCIFRLGKMIRGPSHQVMLEIYQRAARRIPAKMKHLDYLEREKHFSRTMLKNYFNTSQREKLIESNSANDYDMTLLHLLITLMRAQVTDTKKLIFQDDDLEKHLRAIKNFRNNVMHDVKSINDSDLMEQTEILREHLTSALEVARDVYIIDQVTVNRIIQLMNSELNNIRDNPLEQVDITTYQSQQLFLHLQKLLSDSGTQELKKVYDKWSYLNPVSFIDGSDLFLEVGIVFTRMEIIEDGILQKVNKQIEHEKIFEHVHDTSERNMSSEMEIVLIEGPAGAGKTTLTKLMMQYWIIGKKTIKGLTDYDVFLYSECRNPSISSLPELLKSLMPETAKKFRNEDDILKCILEFRLLMVVDGLDELNASSTKLFKEILNIKRTCCATIVCTARPEMVSDFYKMIPDDLTPVHMKVLGIPDNRRTEFAANYHDEMIKRGKSQQNTKELINYVEKCPGHFQEHFRLPLNLVLLTVLWALAPNKINNVSTATEMYMEILQLIREKLLERLKCNECSQYLSIEEMKRRTDVFFSSMCQNALISLRDDVIILTEELALKLKDVCSSISLPPEEVTSAFLVQKNTLTTLGIQSYLSFPHKGLQDFYSALFVLQTLMKKYECQNLDMTNIIKDFQGILEHHQVHSSIWPDLINSIRNTLEPKVTIFSILRELHKESTPLTYGKYQNVLIHLAGLLHLNGRTVQQSTAMELVTLLKSSGMVDRKQWLDLLTEVKCDPAVTKYIAQQVPQVVKGEIDVKDSSVAAYASLLLYAQPESVRVVITENPENIPCMEDMIKALAQLDCKVNIYIEHDFRYPRSCNISFDNALQLVLSRCKVEEFRGCLNKVKALPITLKELHLIIVSDSHAQELLPDLQASLLNVPQLNLLRVHVPVEVCQTVPNPLPEVQYVQLYLTQVEEFNMSQACQLVKALQPPKGFNRIDTSECDLTPNLGMKFECLLSENRVKTEEYVPFSYYEKASMMQALSEVNITDSDVKEYSSWLSFASPMKVNLDIKKDPDDLPHLPVLLKTISSIDCEVTIRLNHHYRHPNEDKRSDIILLSLLHDGKWRNLVEFRGHLTEDVLTLLPSTLREVHLSVVSNNSAIHLLPKLQEIHLQLPNLEVLGVHVGPRVSPEELVPLPDIQYVRLYLTKVGDANVDRVCHVAKALQPPGGYSSIRFPDATANYSGWKEVILSLHKKQVAVRGGLGVPDTNVTTATEGQLDTLAENKLNCGLWSLPKERLWR